MGFLCSPSDNKHIIKLKHSATGCCRCQNYKWVQKGLVYLMDFFLLIPSSHEGPLNPVMQIQYQAQEVSLLVLVLLFLSAACE